MIAFTLFGVEIYWYAIIIMTAFLTALMIYRINDGKFDIKFDDFLDIFIITVPITIIGARLYYILFKFDFYKKNPQEILNIRGGGLAIYGGIIAGAICVLILSKIKKINFFDLLDFIVPGLAIGQCIGRWGNFLNGEAHGIETTLPWAIKVTENGVEKFVHPTFLYESIATFIIFCILIKLSKKRKFSGELACIYLILYSFARFFIEGIRTDSLMLYNIRISQILSLIIFVTFCIILSKKINKKNIVK